MSKDKAELLLKEIASLEEKISEKRLEYFRSCAEPKSVQVPGELSEIFKNAELSVAEHFSGLRIDPSQGLIDIGGERYVFFRASALSHKFIDSIKHFYSDSGPEEAADIGFSFLFDLAHLLGLNDARIFHEEMKLKDPIAKLSAGPVHFAFTGWAVVDILEESSPTPDNDYYIRYHHLNSFEADSWIRAGKSSKEPVCILSAGYSSGWCEQSFGIPLTAVETSCRARGDSHCSFVMAPPDRIEDHLDRLQRDAKLARPKTQRIPLFLKRKQVEERLERARTQAEESAKLKSHFLANVSHEVRTPLHGVIGMAELLLESKLNENQTEIAQTIRTSSESLIQIVNDLLDISKIEANKLELHRKRFDLCKLLHECCEMFAALATQRCISLICAFDSALESLTTIGDPGRIRQIVYNLLSNALKFTKDEGAVVLQCRVQSLTSTAQTVVISVSDTGMGIEPDFVSQLFNPFTQKDESHSRSVGGTGLGLTISQRLAKMMNSEVKVASRVGCGSVFWLELHLPIAATLTEERPLPTVTDQQGQSVFFENAPVILIAEDNPVNQRFVKNVLERRGCSVVLANNGEEALKVLEEQRVDLILMDIQMPVLDGLEATKAIREQGLAIPIIALTAHAMSGDRERYMQAGVSTYLSKPFRKQELFSLMKQQLAEKR